MVTVKGGGAGGGGVEGGVDRGVTTQGKVKGQGSDRCKKSHGYLNR